MICELCGKNKAVIHIQEVVDGHKRNVHFCGNCAGNKSLTLKASKEHGLDKLIFDLSIPLAKKSIVPINESSLKCITCGMKKNDFQESGRLGCPDCYESFWEILKGVIPLMHAGNRHQGKRLKDDFYHQSDDFTDTKNQPLQDQVDDLFVLNQGLDEAVKTENFELAAILRDKLSDLENNTSK